MKSLPGILIGAVAVIFLLNSSFFVVSEWEQAIVVQLGKPQRTITDPGLNMKIPFMQSVIRFERRRMEYDADPRELLTEDKQQVVVDNYSRWRIVDPLLFYQSVRTENGAVSRLDDIIYSILREVLGQHTLTDLISGRRSKLVGRVLVESNEKARAYGIEVVDVRIKRADLPEKNEQNVFARMRTERQRMAKKFRAEGDEEAQKIRSTAEKEARIIKAEAKKTSDIIRGRGDAESTKIYARAYNQDAEFYRFVRQLESYKKIFKDKTSVVISPDNELLRTFQQGQ